MKNYERVVAEVDLDAVIHNLRAMQEHVGEDVMMCAVVKADAYGHGAVPVAKAVRNIASWFATATVEEAMNLRHNGITEPILILGFVPEESYEVLAQYELRPNVYEPGVAVKMSGAALKAHKSIKVHIKLDTGMNRLGFQISDHTAEQIIGISRLPGIEVEGIFTHFTASDEADKSKAKKQLKHYGEVVKQLEYAGMQIPIKHCCNSAGIIDIADAGKNMVRAGIAAYGLYPSDEVCRSQVKLSPALSLKSRIVYLKDVPAGEGISYGSTYVTAHQERIATVPVGYGDGYPRALSNLGYVLIHGRKAPIRGRICMDQFMVDVSDIPQAAVGDTVTLIGKDDGESITVEDLTEPAGLFHYEFLCDLGKRIPRRYWMNGEIVCEKDYFIEYYPGMTI